MEDRLLTVTGLTISRPLHKGEHQLVGNIHLTMQAGEAVGLAGPSGCGKTLFCSALLGMLEPPLAIKAGSILYRGRNSQSLDLTAIAEPAWRYLRGKEIAMIFQNPMSSLNHSSTIGAHFIEMIRAHRKDLGKKAARELAEAALLECMLSEPVLVMKSYPFELSGGMCQRAIIAMALIHKPALLIADEPTTALDRRNEEKILELLVTIRKTHNMALLFVSHDEQAAASVTSRQVNCLFPVQFRL